MHVTPLELGLAAAVVVIAFGPKRLPSFKSSADANLVDLRALAPSQPAAARAPSPLARSVAPPAQSPRQPQPHPQPPREWVMSGAPAPLKLPEDF